MVDGRSPAAILLAITVSDACNNLIKNAFVSYVIKTKPDEEQIIVRNLEYVVFLKTMCLGF